MRSKPHCLECGRELEVNDLVFRVEKINALDDTYLPGQELKTSIAYIHLYCPATLSDESEDEIITVTSIRTRKQENTQLSE